MKSALNRLLAAPLLLVAVLACTALSQPTPPNVVFIISDDLTTALGTYGRPVSTPTLDALAARGMRFENAYCQYPVCGPSRVSMMTGLYPAATGSFSNGASDFRNRYPDLTTLPQLFRESGYATARVSKIYHMGVPPDIINGTSGIEDMPAEAPFWIFPQDNLRAITARRRARSARLLVGSVQTAQ